MRVLFVCRGVEQFGVEVLSAVLKQHGHTVGLLFDPGFDNFYFFRIGPIGSLLTRLVRQRLISRARTFAPDVVAVSGFSNHYPYLREFAAILKRDLPALYVIGGVHARITPESMLSTDSPFDAVCDSEGESCFPLFLERLATGAEPADIPGFWFRTPAGIRPPSVRPRAADLALLPPPDKDLFFRAGVFASRLAFSTSRGCPYACSYCQTPHLRTLDGSGVRRLSPAMAVQQLAVYTRQFGSRSITFQDDDFTFDHDWLAAFLPHYQRAIGLPFQCNTHPLSLDDARVALLASHGCRSACLGVQSGSENLRRNLLNRRDRNTDILAAAAALRQHGITVVAEFIFGFPGEREEDIRASCDLAFALAPDNLPTFTYYPFASTSMYERLRQEGLIDARLAERIASGSSSYQERSLFPGHLFPPASVTAFYLLPAANQLRRLGMGTFARRLLALPPARWMALVRLLSLPWFNRWQFTERLGSLARFLIHRNRSVA